MKNQVVIGFVFLLIITAIGSFFLGSKLSQDKQRLIYLPIKNTTTSTLNIKGFYVANATGIVKAINNNSITLQNKDGEATFNLKNDTTVLAPNTDSTSSETVKVDIFKPQKEVSLVSVKTGQVVILQLLISNKEVTVKEINITSNEK